MVAFDHWDDHVILQLLDGKDALASEAKSKRRTFPAGREVTIEIRVRKNQITVQADGIMVLDWHGDFGRLTPHEYYSPGPGHTLGISARNAGFVISRWLLTPIDGSAGFQPRYIRPTTHDRQMAARVCELGGSVQVDAGGSRRLEVVQQAALPKQPFHVVEISGLLGTELAESDFRGFGQLTQLQRLNLQGARFDESWLDMLSPLSGLQMLNLDDTSVTDQGLVRLSTLTSLRDLDLVGTGVTGNAFQDLSSLQELQRISLGSSKRTMEGFQNVLHFKRLRHLNVAGLELTDDDLALLADSSEIEFLHVGWSNVTGRGLVHLSRLPKLRKLDLSGAPLTDEGLAGAGNLSQVRSLLLAKTPITDAALVHLRTLSLLTELDLTGTKVTEQGAQMLLQHLPNCTILLDDKKLTGRPHNR